MAEENKNDGELSRRLELAEIRAERSRVVMESLEGSVMRWGSPRQFC